MKVCKKCNLKYGENDNFCKECGDVLEECSSVSYFFKNEQNRKLILYIVALLIITGSFNDYNVFHGILGIIFSVSLMPIFYDLLGMLNKKMNSKFILKYYKKIKIVLPCLLGVIWALTIPSEPIEYIKINDIDNIISVNNEHKINFSTNLDKINYEDFNYTVSDESVATVKNGVIFPKKEGRVDVKITSGNGISAFKIYNVKYFPLEDIEMTSSNMLFVGENSKIEYVLKPNNASNKTLTWSSSDNNILYVNQAGVLTAKNSGNVIITAISPDGLKKDFEINVIKAVNEIILDNSNVRVEKGKSVQIKFNIEPSDIDLNSLKWSSNDNNIATVENGNITGVSSGITFVTVKSLNGVSKTINVEVYEIFPEQIKINEYGEITLKKGNTKQLNTSIYPSDASDKTIKWTSSNNSIVSVDNGKLTAQGRGEATITAKTSNNKSASIKVTVREQGPIKINNFIYTMDSVCGVEWTWSISNRSNKTINYIIMEWYNSDGLGNLVADNINGEYTMRLKYTGPLNPGQTSSSKRNVTKFYNCSYGGSYFSEFVIYYSDGTTETINTLKNNYYDDLF